MTVDLFAGIPVRDRARAIAWYSRLLGITPAFLPHDGEAVWEVAEHRYLYVVVRPEDAGHATHTLVVDDLDARLARLAAEGPEPVTDETYDNGVRKITFRDEDGNELGLGSTPITA